MAQQIGEQAAKTYLEKADYGNADPSGGKDGYWLDGNIRINAFEQISFLQKLYANSLPFRVEHQRLVGVVALPDFQAARAFRLLRSPPNLDPSLFAVHLQPAH